MVIAFNKPFGVLSQFRADVPGQATLSQFGFPPAVYPVGRLDADSEGLLLLSDEPGISTRLLDPKHGHPRRYSVQLERPISAENLSRLRSGVVVQGRRTLPCRAWALEAEPSLPPRQPPIRFRKNVGTCWIAIELTEGKNRQVRRMTAAVGHPTLRLVRVQIGDFRLEGLSPGEWKRLTLEECRRIFAEPAGSVA